MTNSFENSEQHVGTYLLGKKLLSNLYVRNLYRNLWAMVDGISVTTAPCSR